MITSQIAKDNNLIFAEDLQVKKLLENNSHKLLHYIQNAVFRMILNQFEYKCRWKNKVFIKACKYYPSSKICNRCDEKRDDLTLDVRKWKCKKCGNANDRDLNASINILYEGIKKFYAKKVS